MPIPAVKISASALVLTLLGVLPASSQTNSFGDRAPTGDASSAVAPSAAPAPAVAPPAADTANSLDYLYNHKPQDGSAAKQVSDENSRVESKAIALDAVGTPQEDPQLKADFDRYLGKKQVSPSDLAAYQDETKKVTDLLAANKTVEAWKELSQLAQYQSIDAGIAQELANRVQAVWMTGKTSTKIDESIEGLKKDIKQASWNADLMSVNIRKQEMDDASRGNSGPNRQQPQQPNGGTPQAGSLQQQAPDSLTPPPDTASIQGKLQLTEEYLTSLESKAKIKMNELKEQKLFEQAKSDFAAYIGTLSNTGRYNHVVLAADFYRAVFNEGEYPVAMADQVNKALETTQDVAGAVDVFRYKLSRNELTGATASLEDAFQKNPLNPAVLGLERPLKEQVADYRQKIDKLRNLIEARDFSGVDTLLADLSTTAKDFDATKAKAVVNGVKLDSQLRLGQAKLAAQQGNQKEAMEDFQAAAEAWPGNPDLQDKATLFFNAQDSKTQAITEFDRLVGEKNYRGIFDKQLAFAPALDGDTKRQDQLKEALQKVQGAEIAVQKANTLLMNGDSFGAWETIELASKDLPDDEKLNKMLADLSGRSAEFVSAINKARDAEGRDELGYSLTWYVNAQRQYPASQIANEGIDRLSKKLLQSKS